MWNCVSFIGLSLIMTKTSSWTEILSEMVPKPGTCPSLPADLSLLTCVPAQECMFDTHCEGAKKCCFNGCGAVCVLPNGQFLTFKIWFFINILRVSLFSKNS